MPTYLLVLPPLPPPWMQLVFLPLFKAETVISPYKWLSDSLLALSLLFPSSDWGTCICNLSPLLYFGLLDPQLLCLIGVPTLGVSNRPPQDSPVRGPS